MDFGRLPAIEGIDFSLPADDARTKSVLATGDPGKWEVYTGCPVWTSSGWIGRIFPESSREKDLLKLYSRQFNSIELNATHYNIPAPVTVQRWKKEVPSHFRFFPKISRQLNHDRGLEDIDDLLSIYCNSILEFGENLGMCFLQLPPAFSTKHATSLEKFLLRFKNSGIPLAVEFRHPSWFGAGSEAAQIFRLMEKEGITSVITDVAGRRDVLHMRLTTKAAFVRFAANDLHPTDFQRMNDWIDRIKDWKEQGLEKLFFFFHNPHKSKCVELAIHFTDRLNEICGTSLKKPILINSTPLQTDLFGGI